MNGATWQITSTTFGENWEAPTSIDPFLGKYRGVFPGPGNAIVLSNRSNHPGRYVFPAWGVNKVDHGKIYDIVYFSDDAGKTYSMATHGVFPANMSGIFEEPTLAETQSGAISHSFFDQFPIDYRQKTLDCFWSRTRVAEHENGGRCCPVWWHTLPFQRVEHRRRR